MSDCPTLLGKTVLVVGGTKNIGLRIAQRADVAGARVVIAGRDAELAGAVASTLSHARGLRLDVTDEDNIASAAAELGFVEHIVVTAAAPHHAAVTEPEHDKVVHAFEAKVIGPLMLAKHFAPRIAFGGSMAFFSGVAAWKPAPGRVVTGIIDRGASCDAMPADESCAFLDDAAAGTLTGHVGRTEHIIDAVMWLLTASFVSGETIHVDGGARSS